MEYLWRHPYGLGHSNYVRDARESSPFSPVSPNLKIFYRRLLLVLAVACFLAHVVVLALIQSHRSNPLFSEILQFILGLAAFLAMLDAGRRSRGAPRWAWYYASAAIGTYTLGQLVFTAYQLFGQGMMFSPRITSQFFFFWVAPLLAAGAIDSLRGEDGYDSTVLLDLSQFVILGMAFHLIVFGDASRWQSHPQQMEFLKFKVRLLRDVLVLNWLWGRAWFTRSWQLRELFARLGVFYLFYSITDAVCLYAEAAWNVLPGTWFDLLWSLPRLVAVVLAFTWNWKEEPTTVSTSRRPSTLSLGIASLIVPMVLLAIGFRAFSTSPGFWASLMVASFAVASVRLLVVQSRQKRTLAELHSSMELLHSIVEGTSEAIYLKDRDGRYLLINTAGARYLGRTVNEILGKIDQEILSPETIGPILKVDREVMTKGETVTCEEMLTEQGDTRTFLSTKNPYRDAAGRVTGVLGISVEITQHRRMEEQLRRIQRMESIGAFSGAIAHDFSNILTVIKGYSQITQTGLADRPLLQENLAHIVKAADRAAALISQLLAFSRQQVLQPRVINLNDVTSKMLRMLERLIGTNIQIVTHLAPDLWVVRADPSQIEHVLMNLAANARDAMPQGGKLFLETANVHLDEAYARANLNAVAGDYVMFALTDTGMGMDEQTRARMFEPFFSTKAFGKGSGLGLATAYGIIRQSGGHIAVESQIGTGSTFRVYLPRVEQPQAYQIQGPPAAARENYKEASC